MKILIGLMLTLMLSIASFSFAENAMTVEEMISEAEQANKMAAEIGYEWRDTAMFIEQAKTAHSEGDEEVAFDLAKRAYEQAVLATQQGVYMRENWQQYIPL